MAAPLRPRLKATIEVLRPGDGSVYLVQGAREDVQVADTPVASAVLELADGSRSSAEILAGMRAQGLDIEQAVVDDGLATLLETGVLEDAAEDDRLSTGEVERYDRQLRYFADLAEPGLSRSAFQERLREARVTIIGVGGLGSWAAYGLACAGVGRLDLIDGDVVEESNLNRQILYTPADVGLPKAAIAGERLSFFNPGIEIRTHAQRLTSSADVQAAVKGADFVVDAADWPPHAIERWVNQACFEQGIPYFAMGFTPPLMRLGPTYVPGQTGCYSCQEAAYRQQYPLYDALAKEREGQLSPAAAFGPACAVIGGWASLEAVHQLSGLCSPATIGAALLVDVRDMKVARLPIEAHSGCPVCGHSR